MSRAVNTCSTRIPGAPAPPGCPQHRRKCMLLEGNLTGVQHLGIFTADLAAAQAWYIDKLGFELTASPSFEMGGDRYALAFLQRDDLVLELVLPPAAARDEVRSRGHGHIDHF